MSDTCTCPHCGKELAVDVTAMIPDRQRFTITMTCKGKYLSAAVVGLAITTQARILRLTARQLGTDVCVFVENVAVSDGRITIEFLITACKSPGRE